MFFETMMFFPIYNLGNMMKKLLLLLAAVAIVGCANQRFDLKSSNDANVAFDDAQTFWVGGIGQSTTVDAAKVCGNASKIANVVTEQTGSNVLLSIVTIGIYSPRQVRISCSK
jgi:uncharacterized lipoprotein YajG